MCALLSLFFLGGWYAPISFFQVPFWFGIKIAFLAFCFVWIRATYPRYRYECEVGWELRGSDLLSKDTKSTGLWEFFLISGLSIVWFKVCCSIGERIPLIAGVAVAQGRCRFSMLKVTKYGRIVGRNEDNKARINTDSGHWKEGQCAPGDYMLKLREYYSNAVLSSRIALSSKSARESELFDGMKRIRKVRFCNWVRDGLGLRISNAGKNYHGLCIQYCSSLPVSQGVSTDRIHGLQKMIGEDSPADFPESIVKRGYFNGVTKFFSSSLKKNGALMLVKKRSLSYDFNRPHVFFALSNLRKKGGKFRKILKDLISEPLILVSAYNHIKSKSGNLLDDITWQWCCKVSKQLKEGTFKWGTSRKISSSTRPVLVGDLRDRIVQRAIYLVLNEIYENKIKIFNSQSYGLRPGKSVHAALKEIKFGWCGVNWFLEFDIKQVFSSINRNILMTRLKEQVQDEALFALLYKMFKSRAWSEDGFLEQSKLGAFQGNILNSLLLNIYLDSLDRYLEELKKKYNCEMCVEVNPVSSKAAGISSEEERLFSKVGLGVLRAKKFETAGSSINRVLQDNTLIRIKYVRYADAFVIGVTGNKRFAKKIMRAVGLFIESQLQLTVNKETSRFINAYNGKIHFLGMVIYCVKEKNLPYWKPQAIEKRKRIQNRILLRKNLMSRRISKDLGDALWKRLQKIAGEVDITNFQELSMYLGKDIMKLGRRAGIRCLARSLKEIDFPREGKRDTISDIRGAVETLQNWKVGSLRKGVLAKSCRCTRKHIVMRVIEELGDVLGLGAYNYASFRNTEVKYLGKWPETVQQPLAVPEKVITLAKSLSSKTRRIYTVLGYLSTVSQEVSGNSETVVHGKREVIQRVRPLIEANVKGIYEWLQRNGIMKDDMKPRSRLKSLLSTDVTIVRYYRLLAEELLFYYRCCDNLERVKSIVAYYLRMSLVLTLKHKHKLRSTLAVKCKYGEPITVRGDNRLLGQEVSFLSLHEINSLGKSFLAGQEVKDPFCRYI